MTTHSGRIVIVSGASRGIGVGICRQILSQDPNALVIVTARSLPHAESVRDELNTKYKSSERRRRAALAFQCDVTDEISCQTLAKAVSDEAVAGVASRPLSLVNNAGVALDLPWFPSPWPASAAADTLEVNLYGAERLTRALLPQLLASNDGRVVFVSSGGGRANMQKMDEGPRAKLLDASLTWNDLKDLAFTFQREYEEAATAAIAAASTTSKKEESNVQQLPFLSSSGLWLQSYGFSKACLGAYCQILARQHSSPPSSSLLSVCCSPGFISTNMTKTYSKYDELKSIDEGGEVEAWLATGDRRDMMNGSYYQPDRTIVSWVAGMELEEANEEREKSKQGRRLTTLELKKSVQ